MALIGLSLLVASVVYVIVRPPHWFWTWRGLHMLSRGKPSTTTTPNTTTPTSTPPPPPPTPPSTATPPIPLLTIPSSPSPPPHDSPTTPKAPTLSLPDDIQPLSMPPPPPPPRNQFPAPNSAQRAALAPPPTTTSKPPKPSRKVLLAPGRSPLDWARISSSPSADLRGLPPSTPYLRVTPSMLRCQTGRRGKDAWLAINGRVYNVSPYADFHPGGVPELMRGAARDATKLFGEIHPWVNHESMLAACLVGLLVDETEPARSDMDTMD